eukprot:6210628-Pleurochrysis_carterae.AAC.1
MPLTCDEELQLVRGPTENEGTFAQHFSVVALPFHHTCVSCMSPSSDLIDGKRACPSEVSLGSSTVTADGCITQVQAMFPGAKARFDNNGREIKQRQDESYIE